MDISLISFYILIIPFLVINFWIIFSDFRKKLIPNKYLIFLLLLIPYRYFYLIHFGFIEHISDFASIFYYIVQLIATFIISFVLYHLWMWSAGDAKYLLILWLFIPHIWIVPFIWNIGLITIIYLILYFFYFYFYKLLRNRNESKSLFQNLKIHHKQKFLDFCDNYNSRFSKKIYVIIKIFDWIVTFFLFFTIIRLLRFSLVEWIINTQYNQYLTNYIEQYSSYIFIWLIIIFFATLLLMKFIFNRVKEYLEFNTNIDIFYFIYSLKSIFLFGLIFYLLWEYQTNPIEITEKLILIFTTYLIIYIIVKSLWFSYKISFIISEQFNVDITNIKQWDIIDKSFILETYKIPIRFWKNSKNTQHYSEEFSKKLKKITQPKYFHDIKNVLDETSIKKLEYAVLMRNKFYHIENKIKNTPFTPIYNVKVLKTFAFWWYIFIWFMMTYFIWDYVFIEILKFIVDIIFSAN